MGLINQKYSLSRKKLGDLSIHEFLFLLALTKVGEEKDYKELYRKAVMILPHSSCFSFIDGWKIVQEAMNCDLIRLEITENVKVVWLIDLPPY